MKHNRGINARCIADHVPDSRYQSDDEVKSEADIGARDAKPIVHELSDAVNPHEVFVDRLGCAAHGLAFFREKIRQQVCPAGRLVRYGLSTLVISFIARFHVPKPQLLFAW